MATYTFNGTSQTTPTFNPAADLVVLGVPTSSIREISQQGSNVVVTSTTGTLTLTGVSLASLAQANFAIAGGGVVQIGDNTSNATNDIFSNTLAGGEAGDILLGLGGNDIINAGNGANLVFGGSAITDPNDGNDAITSGTGNDTIYGNGGDDVIGGTGAAAGGANTAGLGNTGSDLIFGGIGSDQIAQQTLAGQSTSVYGGGGFLDTVDGADVITLQNAGTLFVTGNAGGDTITVTQTAGSSSVYGGLGNDTITVNATGAGNVVIGGGSADADTITYDATGIANTNATIYGGTGSTTDTVDGADTINILSAGNTTVYANAGADSVTAALTATSNTVIYGGLGNDSITASIVGTSATERANLTIFGGSADSDVININQGAGQAGNVNYNAVIYGGSSINDSTDLADTIVGGNGNEIIYGNGGNDRLVTGAGDDQLFGGAGTDLFVVNGGGTKIIGDAVTSGATADTVLLQSGLAFTGAATSGSNTTLNFGAGNSIVFNNSSSQLVTVGVDANSNFELAADEARIIVNNSTTAAIAGGGGNDTIIGGIVAENISGGAGLDSINGGAGNDTINGGDGNDVIIGGAGQDSMTGGATTPGSALVSPASEVQTITFTGNPVTGEVFTAVVNGQTATFTVGATQTTDAAADGLRDAINALTAPGTLTDATATSTGGVVTLTFPSASGNVPQVVVTDSNGNGTGSAVTTGTTTDGNAGSAVVAAVNADTFVFATNADAGSSFATADLITDLNLGGTVLATNGDIIDIAVLPTAVINGGVALAATSLDNAIDQLAGNNAGLFTNGGQTYLVIDQGANGSTFVAGEDLVINVSGVTGTLSLSDFA